MSVREANFNRKFRSQMFALGFKFDRIESHATAPGIPDDAWVHECGKSGWIEIKECESFPAKMPYRPMQALWLDEHWRHNGNCCTLLHLKKEQAVILVPGDESIHAERDMQKWSDSSLWINTDDKHIWTLLKYAILTLKGE